MATVYKKYYKKPENYKPLDQKVKEKMEALKSTRPVLELHKKYNSYNELTVFPDWRFVALTQGDKTPFEKNWPNNPRQLKDISMKNNIGLLLGKASAGIVAIDFDGSTVVEFWNALFENTQYSYDWIKNNTTVFTSGKTGRSQALFKVPMEYWNDVTKIVLPIVEGEQLEFRWNGSQSVLPPSKLNDGRNYKWINHTAPIMIPEDILVFWLEMIVEKTRAIEYKFENKKVDSKDLPTELELRGVLNNIRKLGRLEHENWNRVLWGTFYSCGGDLNKAKNLILEFFKDRYSEDPIKYNTVLKSWSSGKTIRFGTLVRLSQAKYI